MMEGMDIDEAAAPQPAYKNPDAADAPAAPSGRTAPASSDGVEARPGTGEDLQAAPAGGDACGEELVSLVVAEPEPAPEPPKAEAQAAPKPADPNAVRELYVEFKG